MNNIGPNAIQKLFRLNQLINLKQQKVPKP